MKLQDICSNTEKTVVGVRCIDNGKHTTVSFASWSAVTEPLHRDAGQYARSDPIGHPACMLYDSGNSFCGSVLLTEFTNSAAGNPHVWCFTQRPTFRQCLKPRYGTRKQKKANEFHGRAGRIQDLTIRELGRQNGKSVFVWCVWVEEKLRCVGKHRMHGTDVARVSGRPSASHSPI